MSLDTLLAPAGAGLEPMAEAEEAAVSGDAFRGAMRHLAGAVSIVTAGRGAERNGLTATSVVSLSVDPPTVLLCVNRSASAWPLLVRHGHFGVSVLAASQRAIADRFAGRGGERGAARFEGADWVELSTGAPILADALVAFDCVLEERIERHSHGILIGRVQALHGPRGPDPLLYWRGTYGAIRPAP
ncbi:flavin reductase family protein [Inquilinus limosus]|uniref:flavin reductase family protein n=1 Tax=Inquilinus limosus TaxID=171674 RepID=UPI003F15B347